jgi:hypothetical protein
VALGKRFEVPSAVEEAVGGSTGGAQEVAKLNDVVLNTLTEGSAAPPVVHPVIASLTE